MDHHAQTMNVPQKTIAMATVYALGQINVTVTKVGVEHRALFRLASMNDFSSTIRRLRVGVDVQ